MKKIFTTLFATVLLFAQSLNAANIEVGSVEEFNNAILTYSAGDTILLASGDYALNAKISITQSLAIKASASAQTRPVLSAVQFVLDAPVNFHVEGIEAYYDAEGAASTTGNYFLQAINIALEAAPIEKITFKNLVVHGYGRGMLRSDKTNDGTYGVASITNLVLDNVYAYDMGRNSVGYSVLGVKTAKVSNATIKNSTFYNSPSGIWNAEDKTTPLNFWMENCTVLKTSQAGSKKIITNKINPGSVHTIKNSIFSDSYDGGTDNMSIRVADSANVTGITCNIENTILANNFVSGTKVIGPIASISEVIVESLTYDASLFTITTTPTTTASLGDPRWVVNNFTGLESGITQRIYGRIENGQIELNNLEIGCKVSVFNLQGQKTITKINSSNHMQIPFNGSSAIVLIESLNGIQSIKLIK